MWQHEASTGALQWKSDDGLCIAFSTRAAGDLRDASARARWWAAVGDGRELVTPGQIHGSTVAVAGVATSDELAAADGVVSPDGHRAVGVFGSDCPGLVLTDGIGLCLAHCGWRGVAAGMVLAAVAALQPHAPQRHTANPVSKWQAFIGPAISGPHYQVDQPVLAARTWPSAAITPDGPEHARLDLSAAIAEELRTLGLSECYRSDICTANDPRLHSYRHDGPGLTQLLVAWRGA